MRIKSLVQVIVEQSVWVVVKIIQYIFLKLYLKSDENKKSNPGDCWTICMSCGKNFVLEFDYYR